MQDLTTKYINTHSGSNVSQCLYTFFTEYLLIEFYLDKIICFKILIPYTSIGGYKVRHLSRYFYTNLQYGTSCLEINRRRDLKINKIFQEYYLFTLLHKINSNIYVGSSRRNYIWNQTK